MGRRESGLTGTFNELNENFRSSNTIDVSGIVTEEDTAECSESAPIEWQTTQQLAAPETSASNAHIMYALKVTGASTRSRAASVSITAPPGILTDALAA